MENKNKEQVDEKVIDVATRIIKKHLKAFEVLGNG